MRTIKHKIFNIILITVLCLLFDQILLAAIGDSLVGEDYFSQDYSPDFIKYIETLRPNEIYIRQLKGNEKALYRVQAEKGKCLRFIFEQKGIDIMIALRNSEKEILKKVDRPSGSFGRETFTFIAPNSGIFEIEIKAWREDAINGNYQFSYTVADSPTENSIQRSKAEDIVSEAELLRGSDSKENKEKALHEFEKALEIWNDLGEIYEQAVVYYGIGYTHYGLSNHYKAALYYNRAIKLHSQINNEFGLAINYVALGSVKYALNNNELSAYYFKKAINIYKAFENVRGLGIAYHGLGTEQFLSEKYDEAVNTFTQSLKWRDLANDSVGKARTHISLAKLYLFIQDLPKAKEHLVESEGSFGKSRAENDADLNYYSGKYYLANNEEEKALESLEKALAISTNLGNKLGIALILVELSRTNTKLNDYKKALENIHQAVSIIEKLRQSTLDFRERVNFTGSIQPFYEQYILLLMKMNERYPDKDFNKIALEISEQSRARDLLDKLERRRLIHNGLISDKLLLQEQLIRDTLSRILLEQSKKAESKLTSEFLEVSAEYAEVESEISSMFKGPETGTIKTLKTSEIQDYLDKETILLEYWITKESSFLFFVSDENIKSYNLENGEKIESLAKKFFNCISKPTNSEKCQQINRQLSQILLTPIAKEVQNKKLLIVKKGFLQYISFSALIDPTTQNYLIEHNEIVTLPSVSVLTYLNKFEDVESDKNLAVFADPIYSEDDGRIVSMKKSNVRNTISLPRLFASRFESQAIASFFKPENLLSKTDSEVSRQSLFALNLKDYQIIHFATHAIIDDQNPELSAIILSLYDKNGNYEDGFLRLTDILRLKLNADLVVLSSCQSGAGKQIKGEGLTSLSNTFFASGANNLLASLWEVDDKVTAEIMKKIYRKHIVERKRLSTALRESQIEIMKDGRWNSPFYWSAFILQGNSIQHSS